MSVRSKTRGSLEIRDTSQRYGSQSGNLMGSRNDVVAVDFEETVGEDIPNYFRRRNSGELLPMTNFWQFSSKGQINSCVISQQQYNYTDDNRYNHWVGRLELFPEWKPGRSDLIEIADRYDAQAHVQDAAARIMSSGHDSLTFAAELAKTVAMFKNFVGRLIDNLRKKKFEDIWLEGRFGWRTLVYDMQDIHEQVQKLGDLRNRFSNRAGATNSYSRTFTKDWNTTEAKTTIEFYDVINISVRGAVVAEVKPDSFRTSLPATTWELITLSFVVDWLLTVGSTIDAMSLVLFSDNYVASTGYHVTVTRTGRVKDVVWLNGWSGERVYDTACTSSASSRTPTTISSIPRSRFNLTGLKVVDLVALYVKALRRIR